MALINLKHIGKLYTEARLRKSLADSYSFSPKGSIPDSPDDQLFIGFMRMYSQAKNLSEQLTKLRKVCLDFAAGNMAAYIEEHESYGDGPFDPFDELTYFFDSETIFDLPATIQQYVELHQMSLQYARIREISDEAIKKLLPGINFHLGFQEGNEVVYIPEKDIPEDFLNQAQCAMEIGRIDVEYCLDNYNSFYLNCRQTIEEHRGEGDIEACALTILAMYDSN